MNRQEKIQVEREKNRYAEKVTKMLHSYYYLAIIVGLCKTFGFKNKRLKRALKSIIEEVDKLSSGMIGMTDYMDYAEKLTKFKWEEKE